MDKPFEDDGLFSWNELITNDFEKSFEFYSNFLNWKLIRVPGEGRGNKNYALISNENSSKPFAGIMEMPELMIENKVPVQWRTYITVKNIKQRINEAKENGAIILIEPIKINGVGTVATIKDKQGGVLCLIEYIDEPLR